ncbi:MAG: hypothetical protein OXC62_09755, partial [Aestuariivita sp.]|nr:hypothetical protein [Aestuariivita sp.]
HHDITLKERWDLLMKHRQTGQSGAILYRRVDAFRERRLRCILTGRTHTAMGNVIGHDQRRRLQKIMDLPDFLGQ